MNKINIGGDRLAKLWENDNFTNQNIPFLFNMKIYEYDMKEAGFSLTKEFALLDPKIIEKLSKYKKDKRKVELGLIQRKDANYRNDLKLAFKEARRFFFEENNLDDNDVISIKKDAIFTKRKCEKTKFGNYIEFRVKNEYTSYIKLDKKLEFYYRENTLDIKGMNEENMKYHKDYMISFIIRFFNKMETSDKKDVIEFVKRFIDKYKWRELEVGYYRTFDFNSCYRVLGDDENAFMEYYEKDKDDLDISYNFNNILLKLLQIPL